MNRLETLIDNLLIYLPNDIPFLVTLIQQPDGRYILLGIVVVVSLLFLWLILAAMQMIFFSKRSRPEIEQKPPVDISAEVEKVGVVESESEEGFSFFKKAQDTDKERDDEVPVLVAIEQEMLAVRALYVDGHIIKDVYVTETRRLYSEAQTVKNSQSE